MIVAPRLAVLLWRRGGARQRATLALTAVGVLASVLLALLASSVAPALGDRADRVAWRNPGQNTAGGRFDPSAAQRTRTDQADERLVTRVDLAPLGPEPTATGAPPGLARFPAPGEVFTSPAMAELLATTPADELDDRYPGEVVGTIGAEGLGHEGELVVVVGHPAGALGPVADVAPSASMIEGPPTETAVAIATFARRGSDPDLDQYATLARMAAVLLVIPTLLLVGAAARLTAAQREQRLAVLRLAGATPAAVVALTALEVLVASVVGTALGIGAYLLALPAAARVPLAGGTFPVADLRFGTVALATVLVAVPLLAAACAVVALRTVVIGPLGVSRRTRPRRPSLVRFTVLPVAWGLFVVAAASMGNGGSSAGALVGLAAVIATLAVMGPWITWTLGALLTRVARRPGPLLAGRRISADPKGAYRTISGMVLAGLVAGFLFAVLPTLDRAELGDTGRRELAVGIDRDREEAVRDALRTADPGAVVVLDGWRTSADDRLEGDPDRPRPPDERADGVVVASSPDRLDRVRTAIAVADPTATAMSWDGDGRIRLLLDDLGRASTILALASLAMATAATAISGCSSILDQRLTLARLRLVGTPIDALQRARRWQVLVPLGVASIGAMASGAVAGVVMLLAFDVAPARIATPEIAPMVGLGAAALAAGAAVVALTRPLLVVTSRSSPRG